MSKIPKIFVALAGSISVLIALTFFYQEISNFLTWKSSGIIDTGFTIEHDSIVIFNRIDSTDFEFPPLPDSGDPIIAMDDTSASLDYLRDNIYKGYPPGKELILRYLHDGDTLSATIKTRPVAKSEILQDLPAKNRLFFPSYK